MLPEMPHKFEQELLHPTTHDWNLDEIQNNFYIQQLYQLMFYLTENYQIPFLPANLIPAADRAMIPWINEACPNAIFINNKRLRTGLYLNMRLAQPTEAELPIIRRIPSFDEYGPIARTPNNLYYVFLYPKYLEMTANYFAPNQPLTEEHLGFEGLEAANFFYFYELIKCMNLGWQRMWERAVDPTNEVVQEEMAALMQLHPDVLRRDVLANKRFLMPNMQIVTFAPDGVPIFPQDQ